MNAFPQPPSSDSDIVERPTLDASFTIEDRGGASGDGSTGSRSTIRAVKILGANGLDIRLKPGCRQSVGRAKLADIVVSTDEKMSRKHLSLECTSEHAVVRDLGSMNGTFVNGRRVQVARLGNHDQIIAGSTIFTVQIEYEDG